MRDIGDRGASGGSRAGRSGLCGGRRTRPRAASFRACSVTAALGCLLCALPASAIDFGAGAFEGTLDTTLSHGLTFRVEEREARFEDFRSANANDGNRNYGRGLVSNTSKVTTDLDLGNRRFGAFLRATGFVDFENRDGNGNGPVLDEAAQDLLGQDFEILDAYVTGAFEPGGMPVDLRLGRHVLNWGESTFIGGGINAFNRYDVGKLRLPGSELREALAPVSMVSVSAAPNDTLTVEGFYQLEWEETVLDPVGSFFSTNDVAGPGATEVVVNSGRLRPFFETFGYGREFVGSEIDRQFSFGRLTPAINADLEGTRWPRRYSDESDFMSVARGPDRRPGDSGQWGVALRYLAEDLNQTELGLYFGRYHSRVPIVSARTAGPAAIQAGLSAAGAVSAETSRTRAAVTAAVRQEVLAGVQAGLISRADAQRMIVDGVRARLTDIATTIAIDRYTETPDRAGATGHYFLEYPEDIRFLGLSFNSELGGSGWTLQGEYTLHIDTPLQRAQDVLLGEGIAPITDALGRRAVRHAPYAYVVGYTPHNVSQLQVTATKAFGPRIGADGLTLATEVAMMRVHGMGEERIESPARPLRLTDDEDEESADAATVSWGYRVSARLRYTNAIGAVGLFPFVQFGHDVSGDGPTPIGQFAEGRTALTVGVGADYLRRWQADVGLTMYGGRSNARYDRDFLSASLKFSF